ncbi:hypothetical protein [Spongiactinospora sp. TRM90649]|uniref:hypothetical protein n=1 Tax=Spongiactinospora sp. TRM90649 TaxID=3031114 RepID=UPI0023F951AB|nr:hypothetical protein [Spongiactinospora sp. TRM90649]MDF5751213.1 hypothetical protein [Spongiactinospora sp. TRM90649]
MSALAGAVAAVIALVAYLAPPTPQPSPPDPPTEAAPESSPREVVTEPPPRSSPPEAVTTPAAPPTPSPTPEPSTSPAPVILNTPTTLSEVPPGGCDKAATALTAYQRNAGTTRNGQAAAAQQAYSDLMGAGLDAEGVVSATISRLASEFQELRFRLTGMTGGDPNEVIADINTDHAELRRLCAPG